MNRLEVIQQARLVAKAYRFVNPHGPALGKAGFHGSALAGSSLEYKDFREYRPGDDLRHLDWGAYARSDRLIVKRYHDEVTPHLDIMLDVSCSMDLPDTEKGAASLFFSAFLVAVANQSRYSCRVWLVGQSCQPLDGDLRATPWESIQFNQTAVSEGGLASLFPKLKRNGLRIFISDTLWPSDPNPVLGGLGASASAAFVLRPLTRLERQPEIGGYIRLVDSETGANQQVLMDRLTVDGYLKAFKRHTRAWDRAARRCGVSIHDVDPDTVMSKFEPGTLLGSLLSL